MKVNKISFLSWNKNTKLSAKLFLQNATLSANYVIVKTARFIHQFTVHNFRIFVLYFELIVFRIMKTASWLSFILFYFGQSQFLISCILREFSLFLVYSIQ